MTCFFHSYRYSAASGTVQSVNVTSRTVSSISIQWGRVSCIDRNSVVTGYTVQYKVDGSTASITHNVSGVSNRRLTASGLEPCTSYMFEVAAVNSEGRQSAVYGGTTVQTADRKEIRS